MHQMLLKATTKGTMSVCPALIYESAHHCTFFSLFLFNLSCLLRGNKTEANWETVPDIISSKPITAPRIYSRPPLAPARLKLLHVKFTARKHI